MRLTLRGFQSHEETVLDVQGGLVCVTGPNNVGKSAIVRAARWVWYDSLRGSRFFKKGGSSASCEVDFGDAKVVRIKDRKEKGRNAYELGGVALDAIGKGAPPEVEVATGIWPVRVDKDLEIEANVVQQKDHPFLMDVPGTAKAKVLNALTGHHVLDIAIRETAAKARALKAEEKALEERRASLSEELKAFADLPEKEQATALARTLTERMLKAAESGRRMREALIGLEQARSAHHALAAEPTPDAEAVSSLWDRFEALASKASLAKGALEALAYARTQLAAWQAAPVADVEAADSALSMLQAAQERRDLIRSAIAAESAHVKEELACDSLDIQLDQALSALRSLAGTPCSECGRPMDEACLEVAA